MNPLTEWSIQLGQASWELSAAPAGLPPALGGAGAASSVGGWARSTVLPSDSASNVASPTAVARPTCKACLKVGHSHTTCRHPSALWNPRFPDALEELVRNGWVQPA